MRHIRTLLRAITGLLVLTLPVASRAAFDVNGDGKQDLLWQNPTTGQVTYWGMDLITRVSNGNITPNAGTAWRLADTPDFNFDGKSDLLWQKNTGEIAYWLMNGTTLLSSGFITPNVPAGLRLVAAADLNGDGKPDLIFQNPANGQASYRLLNGFTQIGTGNIGAAPGANWELIGVADIDKNGTPDLLWQDKQNGQNDRIAYWLLNGVSYSTGGFVTGTFTGFNVNGISDIDGDGNVDLLAQKKTDGALYYFTLVNYAVKYTGPYTPAREANANIAGLRSTPPSLVVTRLETAPGYDAQYGTVRVRVKNFTTTTANVAVRVGGFFSAVSVKAYNQQNAPAGSETFGGAIDFRVPFGLTAGSNVLSVYINGKAAQNFTVNVTNTNPYAIFVLDNGKKFVAELRRDKAPKTVDNFVGLATGTLVWLDPFTYAATTTPLYNGTKFHRCIAGFVRQGGDPLTKQPESPFRPYGTGGPGYTIPFEANSLTHEDGALAMARNTPLDSASSQFYVCDGPQPSLNIKYNAQNKPVNGYVVFGKVVQELANAKAINLTEQNQIPIPNVVYTVLTSVIITGRLN